MMARSMFFSTCAGFQLLCGKFPIFTRFEYSFRTLWTRHRLCRAGAPLAAQMCIFITKLLSVEVLNQNSRFDDRLARRMGATGDHMLCAWLFLFFYIFGWHFLLYILNSPMLCAWLHLSFFDIFSWHFLLYFKNGTMLCACIAPPFFPPFNR